MQASTVTEGVFSRNLRIAGHTRTRRRDGRLGHFFQRIKRRKNHNVAAVATVRKLAVIAWRILTTGNNPRNHFLPTHYRATGE